MVIRGVVVLVARYSDATPSFYQKSERIVLDVFRAQSVPQVDCAAFFCATIHWEKPPQIG